MRHAFILQNVTEEKIDARSDRLLNIVDALDMMRIQIECLTPERIDQKHHATYRTQTELKEPGQALYADFILKTIDIRMDDLIIATEPWHEACFKGLLPRNRGKWQGALVVEPLVDYPESFACYRSFVSQALLRAEANPHSSWAVIKDDEMVVYNLYEWFTGYKWRPWH